MAVIKEVPLKWAGTLEIEDFGHFLYQKAAGEMTYTKFIESVVSDSNGEKSVGMLCIQYSGKDNVHVIPFEMRIENPHGKVTDKIPLEDCLSQCWQSANIFFISEAELEFLKNRHKNSLEGSAYAFFSKFDYKEDDDNEQ